MRFVLSEGQNPEVQKVMVKYWDFRRSMGGDPYLRIRMIPDLDKVYRPGSSEPVTDSFIELAVEYLGGFCDLDTGDRVEIYHVQIGTEQYFTDNQGERLFTRRL